jgi:DNA-binding response OmpR family regulator
MDQGQILLVDDDPKQLRIRELILRNAGFNVHIATSAESALAVLRAIPEKIGIVVTDHFLPGINGAELVRELRLQLPSMPVVVLSGMPGLESEYDGLAVNFQTKPFPPNELIRIVQELLRSPVQ